MNDSLYNSAKTRRTRLKNVGYEYEGKIFKNTLSPYLLSDPNRSDILTQIEKTVFYLIEKTKYIKNFFNYTVDKNYKNLN